MLIYNHNSMRYGSPRPKLFQPLDLFFLMMSNSLHHAVCPVAELRHHSIIDGVDILAALAAVAPSMHWLMVVLPMSMVLASQLGQEGSLLSH